jgi:hypothetical protein
MANRQCRFCRDFAIPKSAPKTAFVCSVECATGYAMARTEKLRKGAEKAQKREQRADKAKVRERLKTLSEWVTEAQGWVNKVVVLEDKPKGCISCDSPLVSECGHYFHRGSKYRVAMLTLFRPNLNGQCGHCNRWKGGMQHEYRLGFIARHGEAAFDELVEFKRLTDCGEVPILTVDDCKRIIAESKARIKVLTRGV